MHAAQVPPPQRSLTVWFTLPSLALHPLTSGHSLAGKIEDAERGWGGVGGEELFSSSGILLTFSKKYSENFQPLQYFF